METRPGGDEARAADVVAADLVSDAVALAGTWFRGAAPGADEASSRRLDELLRDPDGPAFAAAFADDVVRPDDPRAAARALERLARRVPRSLPWWERGALLLGGGFAPLLPVPIVPSARRVFRGVAGHLVLDATPSRLAKRLAALRERGVEVDVEAVGGIPIGEDAARLRLESALELLARPDVGAVSVPVSSLVAGVSPWGFETTVRLSVERLLPLYQLAAASAEAELVTLAAETRRDLAVAVAALVRILRREDIARLEVGIAIPAALPEAVDALRELHAASAERVAGGGAALRVRLVAGPPSPLDRVAAERHGWALPGESRAGLLRCLDWALRPSRAEALRIGVAGPDPAGLALAALLARRRGVPWEVRAELPLGAPAELCAAIAADVGPVTLLAPVVAPEGIEAAVPYLLGRVGAEEEDDEDDAPPPRGEGYRPQDRSAGIEVRSGPFQNARDTDPATPGNRRWARGILERVPGSRRGEEELADARVATAPDEARWIVGEARDAGAAWGQRPAAERAAVLLDAADVLEAFRGRLIEVAAAETGATFAEADVEASAAVDAARWYADRAVRLETVAEASFAPAALSVVVPPSAPAVAGAADLVLAALAAGSAVVLAPPRDAERCAAVVCEALWEAGVPRGALRVALIEGGAADAAAPDAPALRALVADPRVDRVLLTGTRETAALFRSWRPDLPLLARTTAPNAVVVTGAADLDLAARDLVRDAFSHAGRDGSGASLAILVGSLGRGEALRRRLEDATRSLRAGDPHEAPAVVGPLSSPAAGSALRALTELGLGESWLIAPRRLDEEGRSWSAGVRDGVLPSSWFARAAAPAPVLGLVAVADLDEAIAVQNALGGAAAGLHSLDPLEVAAWADRVEAGSLAVNRPITGAVVRRQPVGGWGASAVGPAAKSGGPNTLVPLGDWAPVPRDPASSILVEGIARDPAAILTHSQVGLEFPGFDFVRRAALDDENWWASEFGLARDRAGLEFERNVLRYRPAPVTLRLAEGEPLESLVRLLCAAARARSRVSVSSALPLPAPLVEALGSPVPPLRAAEVVVEGDAAFLDRLAAGPAPERLRLIGGDAAAAHEALGGTLDTAIWSGPVTASGRVELLPFLREQSVSVTAHRFGSPSPAMLRLPL